MIFQKQMTSIIVLGFQIFCINVWAIDSSQFDFKQIWSMVEKSDPLIRASFEEKEAAQVSSTRAARHWFPRIFATGKVFSTNDPAMNFVLTLEQRQIGSADFIPTTLNQPGNHFFEQGSIGIDFPLFEGGMKLAHAQALEKISLSKIWEAKSATISEYARVVEDYAGLLALVEERKQLDSLRNNVQGILDRYTIGSKGNPVGYSGLLGLKNLINRIEGLLAQNQAAAQAKKSNIQSVAKNLPAVWQPKSGRTKEFLKEVLPLKMGSSNSTIPASIQAARLGAESLVHAKDVEHAKFLPRLGAFAQGDLYNGSRSTATSYSAGAYLQWDLFSASNFGAIGEAEHRAAAADAMADAHASKIQAWHETSVEGLVASEKTLMLLDESAELLSEQTQVAKQLFRNGSINALQLVEVLNRRADLLVNRRDAELMFAKAKTAVFSSSASDLEEVSK